MGQKGETLAFVVSYKIINTDYIHGCNQQNAIMLYLPVSNMHSITCNTCVANIDAMFLGDTLYIRTLHLKRII